MAMRVRSRIPVWKSSPGAGALGLGLVLCACARISAGEAAVPTSAVSTPAVAGTSAPLNAEVVKLLQSAEEAEKNSRPDVALIELKNAVRLAPGSGEARVKLG